MKFLHFVLCPWICSSVSWFTVYGNLNGICILLLCENFINCNYVELVHSAFQDYYIIFPCSSVGKESACNAEDSCLIPGLGRSSGEGNGNPPQYSCLENPMDRGAWPATYNPWGHKVSDMT